jgi:hypothetical protein
MDLAEIKSDIEALPDSDLYNYEASDGQIYSYGGCDHYEIGINAQDLKALCASHTALEAQVAEMKELLDAAIEIQFVAGSIEADAFKHDKWVAYSHKEACYLGGNYKNDWQQTRFASPLEAFKAVKEKGER